MSKYGEHMGQNCLLCRKDEGDYFSRNFVCILRTTNDSPHGKFHRFLFPFPSKFPDLNFTPFVLYIYPCHETRTWHTQWACVTCNIPILRVRVDSLQIDLFFKKECCLGVRVRVRGSVFPLSCNFYVTNVNFTRVRYKLSSLNVKLGDRGSRLRATFHTLPLFSLRMKILRTNPRNNNYATV